MWFQSDKGSQSYIGVKIAFSFFLLIYSRCGAPASWAERHTTVCLDQTEFGTNSNVQKRKRISAYSSPFWLLYIHSKVHGPPSCAVMSDIRNDVFDVAKTKFDVIIDKLAVLVWGL